MSRIAVLIATAVPRSAFGRLPSFKCGRVRPQAASHDRLLWAVCATGHLADFYSSQPDSKPLLKIGSTAPPCHS